MIVEYRVVLIESQEGCSVSCPALRGCRSQGSTLDEALQNIKSAISEWMDVEPQGTVSLSSIERIVTT
jgi:predicted RNase H-like HicB family nuclease